MSDSSTFNSNKPMELEEIYAQIDLYQKQILALKDSENFTALQKEQTARQALEYLQSLLKLAILLPNAQEINAPVDLLTQLTLS